MITAHTFNLIISWLEVVVQLFTITLLVAFSTARVSLASRTYLDWLSIYSYALALFLAVAGATLSLIYYYGLWYSECDLAWYQHVCLYPIVLLLSIGVFRRGRELIWFARLLAMIGIAVSAYQLLTLYGFASGAYLRGMVSCTQVDFVTFRYMTIPLMAFTGFIAITLLLHLYLQKRT